MVGKALQQSRTLNCLFVDGRHYHDYLTTQQSLSQIYSNEMYGNTYSNNEDVYKSYIVVYNMYLKHITNERTNERISLNSDIRTEIL